MTEKCFNCGASRDPAIPVCPYCGSRFQAEYSGVPFRDLKRDVLQYDYPDEVCIFASMHPLPDYMGTGRLRAYTLSVGVGALMTRLYQRDSKYTFHDMRFHLVIPPRMLIQATMLMESEKWPDASTNAKNTVPRFIACVWIDGGLECNGVSWPWCLFTSEEAVLADLCDINEMYYSTGVTP